MESVENDEEAEFAVSPPAGGVAAARGGSTLSCFTMQDFGGKYFTLLKFGGEPLAKRRPCASQLVAETVRTGRRSPGASKVQARPGSAQRRCDRRVPQVALPQASRL